MLESHLNSLDVVEPFLKALEADDAFNSSSQPNSINVQIIGGVSTVALERSETVIDFEAKQIIAPKSLYLSTHRLDGSLRDLDILVQSAQPSAIDHVLSMAQASIGDALELSVFGFKDEATLAKQLSRPFGLAALKTFLSDRYCQDDDSLVVKSLFPFSTPIDKDSLETWTLSVGDSHIPVPNPAASIINYTNRSIAGVRPKDKAKIAQVAGSVFAKAPELRDWAVDGPGASQVALGGLIRSLTPDNNHPNYFRLPTKLMTTDELAEHEFFMLPELTIAKKRQLVGLAALKASLLSFGESNPAIVTLWQRHIERKIGSIVENK